MAELSTIARPYAEALFAAAGAGGALSEWQALLDELAALASSSDVVQAVSDPHLNPDQIYGLLATMVKTPIGADAENFLKLIIDNQRLAVLPDVARQFRMLSNQAEGVADCLIESAFPMDDAQVQELLAGLSRKFGVKLKPQVVVNEKLIGGVRVTVGDQVLDTSVLARLAQMKSALTA